MDPFAGEPTPKAWLFLNGPWAGDRLPSAPPAGSTVLAADGGAKHLIELGWPADLLVGDLDSLSQEALAQVPKAPGFSLLTFPRDKDQTDFELLFPLALDRLGPPGRAAARVAVLGGLGGRWDMSLANLLLPWAAPWRRRWRGDQIAFYNGEERIYCLSGPQELAIGGDKLFSLLPSLGPAGPIDVQGDVAYPLANGRLAWGLTRGVSNESGPKGAIVSLKKGSLIVVVGPKASFLRPHRGDPLKPKWADGLEADDLEENLEL